MLCLSYFIVGYLCTTVGLTITQLILMCAVIGMGNYAQYLLGYERGIVFTTQKRPKFVMELDKLNEIIEEENNRKSKRNNKSYKKGDLYKNPKKDSKRK